MNEKLINSLQARIQSSKDNVEDANERDWEEAVGVLLTRTEAELFRDMLKRDKNQEHILCAAIWINDHKKHEGQPENISEGFVICGRRHHNCYQTIKSLTGQNPNESIGALLNSMSEEDQRNHQGFITSLDRFVNRNEGFKIAKANNQIQFGLKATDNGEDSILISENLY